jgi:hypothetical protein
MNGIGYALRQVHEAENQTHEHLLRMAETHAAEHEIHHVALDIAVWSEENVRLLAEAARDNGIELDDEAGRPSRLAQVAREVTSALAGRSPETGLLLLHDLRDLFLRASDASIHWEMLAQIAQAKRNTGLLSLSERCHPQTLRQIRWANTMLKTQTPQVLSSLGS